MSVLIGAGSLVSRGWVDKTSGGTWYCVFVDTVQERIEIWKDIDTTPSLAGFANALDPFPDGAFLHGVSAYIDSSDDIHVFCVTGSTGPAEETGYRVFDTGGDTWLGSWVNPYSYAYYTLSSACCIVVDENDIPHVLFSYTDRTKGTNYQHLWYGNRIGGTWSSIERVTVTDELEYYSPRLHVDSAGDVHAYYMDESDVPRYRKRNGSWGTEAVGTGEDCSRGNSFIVEGITPRYSSVDASYNISAGTTISSQTDTTFDTYAAPLIRRGSPAAELILQDSDRYFAYVDTGRDIHIIKDDGGWTDVGDADAGTAIDFIIAAYQYRNHNVSGEIGYIYQESGAVYFGSYTLAVRRIFITHV